MCMELKKIMVLLLLLPFCIAAPKPCEKTQKAAPAIFRQQGANCVGFVHDAIRVYIGYDDTADEDEEVTICGHNQDSINGYVAIGIGASMRVKGMEASGNNQPQAHDFSLLFETCGKLTNGETKCPQTSHIRYGSKASTGQEGGKRWLCYKVAIKEFTEGSVAWAVGGEEFFKHKTQTTRGVMKIVIPGAGTAGVGKSPDYLTKLYDVSSMIKSTPDFELHESISIDHENLKLCAINKKGGWVAFAPFPSGMNPETTSFVAVGTEIKQFQMKSNTVGKEVNTFTLENPIVGQLDASTGGRGSYMCFTLKARQLKSSSGKELHEVEISWAVGTGGFKHQKHTKTGYLTLGGKEVAYKIPTLLLLHMAFMGLAYLILYPVGALIAVAAAPGFRLGGKWFTAHRACMLVAIGFSLVGIVAIFAEQKEFRGDNVAHGVLGLLAVFLCVMQPINSLLKVPKGHPSRRNWELLHKGSGRLALFIGFFVCILGSLIIKERTSEWLVTFVVVFLAVIIVALFSYLRVRQYQVMKLDSNKALLPESRIRVEVFIYRPFSILCC